MFNSNGGDYTNDPMDDEALRRSMGINPQEVGGVVGPKGTDLSNVQAPDLSQYDRRGGGTGGAMSGAMSGAQMGGAAASVIPGIGTALGMGIGGAIGGIKGAITKHAATAPTDFMVDDARKAIGQEYQHSLGRDASSQELDSQLAGQGWKPGSRYVGESGLNSVLGSIGQSDEAKAYAARGATPPPAAAAPPPTSSAPVASGQQYSLGGGWNMDKVNDANNLHPKEQVGRVLRQFDPRQGYTPDVLAALNKLGIGQFSANGDKLSVAGGGADWNGMNSWDGIKGMHSDNPEWQFGVDNNLDAAAASQAGMKTAPGVGTAGTSGLDLGGSLVSSSPDFFKQLMAKLQGSIDGPSQIDEQALRQLL